MKYYRKDVDMKRLVNKMYKKYPNGFYVNARRSLKDTSQAIKYIGRYLGRAAIAEYRIKDVYKRQIIDLREKLITGK